MRYLILSLSFIFITVPALASSIHEDYAGHTYFTKGKFERIYFDSDGTFTQQLEINWERIPAGNFIKGLWSIKDDKLCLMYTSNLSIQNQQICMDVKRNNKDIIATISDTDNAQPVFHWGNTLNGNYLLKENFLYPEGRSKDEDVLNHIMGNVIKVENRGGVYIQSPGQATLINHKQSRIFDVKWTYLNNMFRHKIWNNKTGELEDRILRYTLGDEFQIERPRGLFYYPEPHIVFEEGVNLRVVPFKDFKINQKVKDHLEKMAQKENTE